VDDRIAEAKELLRKIRCVEKKVWWVERYVNSNTCDVELSNELDKNIDSLLELENILSKFIEEEGESSD
jgi:hypothetical protein